jgi:hypothetical protein
MRRGPGTREDQPSEPEREHDSQIPTRTFGKCRDWHSFALSPAAALEGSPIRRRRCTTVRACRRVAEATQ